jgi:hypothetical protein
MDNVIIGAACLHFHKNGGTGTVPPIHWFADFPSNWDFS